jgi:hypothetical protein
MTRIAYLVTSAREMTLAAGTSHPTGYFAEEALKPRPHLRGGRAPARPPSCKPKRRASPRSSIPTSA